MQNIERFLTHIFGNREIVFHHPATGKKHTYKTLDIVYDYLQLLFTDPSQKLPVLVLLSSTNCTGKSTFVKLLQAIDSTHSIVLEEYQFNRRNAKAFVGKHIVMIDGCRYKPEIIELLIEYSALATLQVRGDFKALCNSRFVITTNNLQAWDWEQCNANPAFWFVETSIPSKENTLLFASLSCEIREFVAFLLDRKPVTTKYARRWFHPAILGVWNGKYTVNGDQYYCIDGFSH